MIKFFEYNWQVRDEWFEWCNHLTTEELLKNRIGGVESILYTLFHIIDVEYSWIRAIQGKKDIAVNFSDYNTIQKLKSLSVTLRTEIKEFIDTDLDNLEDELVSIPWMKEMFKRSEILHHIVAHEIHHIGQLSVWARELNLKPVSANFIGRGI
ncbi:MULTISPECIES: DinB family protein [Bacillus]|uniref:DinB family protein n=1 Tax=Bacillus TaxID=1386 RepID=UPI002DBB5695|nr:DinB family protein [Bacillus mojavensis]MEC1678346.1 DinB family protein [Bacillus mojavensis]MEC1710618.1 DinB family protein [Bacillus mojavensis]